MAYAKTSLRGELRVLRERMRALGLGRRQIAVEFARRYRLRPRAAWRHACGWSLKEAAERISEYAVRSGLGPDGTTVAMTAPHLSEYENWPGPGTTPAGRRPMPYLLALLASVYECTVHDLLDLADYEHMPPAERLGHVRSKDNAVDRACELGAELVTITGQLASDRVKVELARVLTALQPYRMSAAVRELTEAARPILGDSPR